MQTAPGNLLIRADADMFLDLAKKTDVLIENLAPGSMSRLGLGYGDVSAVNPGIVYCSIAGYGQSGPYKDLPAHDHQIQAMSGVMDMNGDPDGPPMRVGLYVTDLVTPLYAALGIYGALRVREQTGKGQHIDASMIDTLAALMFMEPVEFVAAQGLPVRVGNRARDDVTGLYRLKDGDVFITIVNEGRWQRLCNTIGVAELIDDPRYATVALRKERLPELRDIVQARLGRLTCEQGIALLEKAEIPVSRVRGLSEALQDEHFRARGTLRPMSEQRPQSRVFWPLIDRRHASALEPFH